MIFTNDYELQPAQWAYFCSASCDDLPEPNESSSVLNVRAGVLLGEADGGALSAPLRRRHRRTSGEHWAAMNVTFVNDATNDETPGMGNELKWIVKQILVTNSTLDSNSILK